MAIDVSKSTSVRERLSEIGCDYRGSGLLLLPVNFQTAKTYDELKEASEAVTIRKLLRAAQVPLDELGDVKQRLPAIKNKHFQFAGPILFVSYSLYSQNPDLVAAGVTR